MTSDTYNYLFFLNKHAGKICKQVLITHNFTFFAAKIQMEHPYPVIWGHSKFLKGVAE